jgi:hypothetical protein
MKRRNSINGQFAARLIEMLESPAYRVLSRSGHMVLARIEIELAHHGGNDNGRLPVTTEDFVQYGMHRTSVAPAIREAKALGLHPHHRTRSRRQCRVSIAKPFLSDLCARPRQQQASTNGRVATYQNFRRSQSNRSRCPQQQEHIGNRARQTKLA